MAEGYPFLQIKAKVDEAFLERALAPLGAQRFDGSQAFPEGVRAVDFLVGPYALELKTLERDPLVSQPERVARLAKFLSERVAQGEVKLENGQIHLKGAVSQYFWRKFSGAPVGRLLEDAAEQVRSTRAFLNRPDLKGAVFVVNESAPFIDAESLEGLVAVGRRRFASELAVAFYFSAIPAQVAGGGRPVVLSGFDAESPAHAPFCESILEHFGAELRRVFGKERLDAVPPGTKTTPLRAAFTSPVGESGSLTIH